MPSTPPEFTQVARAFWDETKNAHPMIGVIGLSTDNVVERLRIAYDVGFRTFQISLPSWGPVTDDEMLRFFVDVCGTFPDSQFLHYNLPRTKRVLSGVHYARLIAEVPNLVATKNTAGGITGAEDLMRHSPELMHFMGEANFPDGSMFGSVGLLATMGEIAPIRCRELFEAGQKRDLVPLFTIAHKFVQIRIGAVGGGFFRAPHGRRLRQDAHQARDAARLPAPPAVALHELRGVRLPRDEEGHRRRLARLAQISRAVCAGCM